MVENSGGDIVYEVALIIVNWDHICLFNDDEYLEFIHISIKNEEYIETI